MMKNLHCFELNQRLETKHNLGDKTQGSRVHVIITKQGEQRALPSKKQCSMMGGEAASQQ
jgi:hypothetical protein